MLVLTRKSGEKVRIGKDVVVTILDMQAGQVKIGIEAPRNVPIHREEIYRRIQSENRSSLFTDALRPLLSKRLGKG